MFKVVSKKNIILAAIFLVLVAVLLYFILKGSGRMLPSSKDELDENQKISIVQALNVSNEENKMSLDEKKKIIEQVKKEEAKIKPLTDEEKAAIIKSLGN